MTATKTTWLSPLRSTGWRRLAYALISLPVELAGLLLTLVGATGTARRLVHGSARLLPVGRPAADRVEWDRAGSERPGAEHAEPDRAGRWAGFLGRRLLAVPLAAVATVVALVLVANTLRNFGYPLQPERVTDWGGPSLAGRWSLHAFGWLPFAYLGLWLVWGLTLLQQRLLRPTD
ncbi:hypothetical protein [Plantactinospora sonchi]|uniref:Sensor domain-containing protein n=1 Tax=Plantactinospora sonchi TaxID=1544735 RepID=A0ABU7RYA5_9ACTN